MFICKEYFIIIRWVMTWMIGEWIVAMTQPFENIKYLKHTKRWAYIDEPV